MLYVGINVGIVIEILLVFVGNFVVKMKLMLVQDTAASSHDWAGVAGNR